MEKDPNLYEQPSVFLSVVDKMIAEHDDPSIKDFLKSLASMSRTFLETAGQPLPAEISNLDELANAHE